jgi:hypothetical protein
MMLVQMVNKLAIFGGYNRAFTQPKTKEIP